MWEELAVVVAGAVMLGVFAMVRREKTSRDHVLDNTLRGRILGFLRGRPGARSAELWKALEIDRGTLDYHLYMLERTDLVQSTHVGGTARWFPTNGGRVELNGASLLTRGRVRDLAAVVAKSPGLNQQEIAGTVGLSRKTFREYADLLAESGFIREARDRKAKRYYPTDKLNEALPTVNALFARDGVDGRGENGPK